MERPIVTLTTDWGDKGYFGGMLKGLLATHVPGVQVVDVTHHVEPFSVLDATFVVRNGCTGFPKGTVHIIDVDTQPELLAVQAYGQYYLCCNNGLPTMAFGDAIEDVSTLRIDVAGQHNFAALTIFAGAAVMLIHGATMRDLGERPAQLVQRTMQSYAQRDGIYAIYVLHVDSYGNAYLGMTVKEFEELRAGRQFVMTVRDHEITEFTNSYYHIDDSTTTLQRRRLGLTASASGMLEVFYKGGSLLRLVGIKVNELVLLRFK